jgi:hypothetical protein
MKENVLKVNPFTNGLEKKQCADSKNGKTVKRINNQSAKKDTTRNCTLGREIRD